MKARIFTDEQEQFILNNYTTMSNADIASHLGKQYKGSQVNSWLYHHDIKKNGQGCYKSTDIFTEQDISYIKEHYMDMTYNEIGKNLGFSAAQISAKVSNLRLPTKKRTINSFYFHNIDTPLKAYLLGFIYADGWIVYNPDQNNYEFGMQLQSSDRYILDKINEVLGNQNIISHKEPRNIIYNTQVIHSGHTDCLRVYSKQLVEDLMLHGIETNKTQKDVYPILNSNLFFDFLRGYIDGDGCYYSNTNYTYMHITSATLSVLQYLQQTLKTYGIVTHIYSENAKKHRLMCINTNEMYKLVNHLYYEDDLFCLRRKYNLIKHFLSSAA